MCIPPYSASTGMRKELVDAMPDHHLDITRETCPMTFVRTRLALDRIVPGETLHVLLAGDEPHRNVVRNAESLGHAVTADDARPDGFRLVSIRRR